MILLARILRRLADRIDPPKRRDNATFYYSWPTSIGIRTTTGIPTNVTFNWVRDTNG